MARGGREMYSWTNYILGTDCRLLHTMGIRDAGHNTDNYLVLGCLCGATPAAQSRYIRKRKSSPIKPLKTMDRVYRLFADLRGGIPKPHWREHLCQAWILPEPWRPINTRIAALRSGYQRNSRVLSRIMKARIQENWHWRAVKVDAVVAFPLTYDPLLIQEVWIRVRGWYNDDVNSPLPPTRVDITTMMTDRVELYRHVPLPGHPIRVRVQPFTVENSIP